jgi:cytochrome c oxidase subunit 3
VSAPQPHLQHENASIRGDALDVSQLPSYAFGHRSIMWWGTVGMIVIEGTVFVLAIMAYFYLRSQSQGWPPGVANPDLHWGTLNTLILLASLVPNEFTRRAAHAHDLRKVRMGLVICLVFSVAFVGVRFLEFGALHVRWDTNAYGSIVWVLLSLHLVHLLTDFFDSAVLTALMFLGPLEGRRYVDIAENTGYWYFVVAAWIPIYLVIYWAPRG